MPVEAIISALVHDITKARGCADLRAYNVMLFMQRKYGCLLLLLLSHNTDWRNIISIFIITRRKWCVIQSTPLYKGRITHYIHLTSTNSLSSIVRYCLILLS